MNETPEAPCARCGEAHAAGPCAGDSLLAAFVHRELIVLVALIVFAAATFLATRHLAQAHRVLQRQDAERLYQRGRSALARNRPAEAVDRLRRAAAMDTDTQAYALALADAFSGDGDVDAARGVLTSLRGRRPEDPQINLRLARLSRQRGDGSDAVRYYQNALYGVWPPDHPGMRHAVRLEFVRFLLDQRETSRALAELIAMDDSFPGRASAQTEAGELFLRAQDPRRALDRFEAALRLEPQLGAARAGAGTAAYRVGAYRRAVEHFRAVATRTPDQDDMLAVATLVLTTDPLAPRLSLAERRRRLLDSLEAVQARRLACRPAGSEGTATTLLEQDVQTLHRRLRQQAREQSLQTIEDGLDLVRRLQDAVDRQCPAISARDRALGILTARHEAGRP